MRVWESNNGGKNGEPSKPKQKKPNPNPYPSSSSPSSNLRTPPPKKAVRRRSSPTADCPEPPAPPREDRSAAARATRPSLLARARVHRPAHPAANQPTPSCRARTSSHATVRLRQPRRADQLRPAPPHVAVAIFSEWRCAFSPRSSKLVYSICSVFVGCVGAIPRCGGCFGLLSSLAGFGQPRCFLFLSRTKKKSHISSMSPLLLHSPLGPYLTCKPLSCPPKMPIHVCTLRVSHCNTRIISRPVLFPAKLCPFLHISRSITCSSTPSNEGVVSMVNFEDLMDKDFSFLDSDDFSSIEEHEKKIKRIISAGEIAESSQVMVSISSEGFVDQLYDLAPCQSLLVVHDSILTLVCIKEKYDKIKCWQGEVIYVPEKWGPFDVVFLYYLPAMPFELGAIFGALSERCVPGARLVISHPNGRKALEQEQQQFPDVVVSDLPDRTTLLKVAADHSFGLTEFVDEDGLYLAVLKFNKDRT